MKLSDKQKGILALVGLAIVYASMGIFVRYLSLSFAFFQQIYLRLFTAVVIGFLIYNRSLNYQKLKKIKPEEWLLLIFRATTYYLLGLALYTKSILLTKISTVSFIGSIPMTAILGMLLYREKITYKKVAFLLLSFIGVVIISVKDFSSIFDWRLGELLTLISVIFTSLSIVLRKNQSKLLSNNEMSQIIITIAFIMLFFTSFFAKESLPLTGWSTGSMLIVIIAGLANTIMIFLTNYGFEKIQTVIAANILTLEMFFAVLIGLMFYREIPSLKEIFGGVLISFSVIQMNKLE